MAMTVTYEHPVAGLVPPVAVTESKDLVVATVGVGLAADTDAVIVHNLGLAAADLAAGHPEVVLEPLTAAARASLWYVSAKTANNITVTKAGGVGAGAAQLRAHISRPHTIGQ